MEYFLADVRTYISVFSLIFAIWQYLQKRKIKTLISLEALLLHHKVAQALGAVQRASATIGTGGVPVQNIGEIEGYNQAILLESAKLYCNLKNTTTDDIDSLINEHRLIDQYRNIYYTFSDRRRGFIRLIFKWLINIY